MKLNATCFICRSVLSSSLRRIFFFFLFSFFFFNLQFTVADRWAPERVKGLKEERQREGERTSRSQTAWQHFHEKLNRIAGSKQEGRREFLCCDVE